MADRKRESSVFVTNIKMNIANCKLHTVNIVPILYCIAFHNRGDFKDHVAKQLYLIHEGSHEAFLIFSIEKIAHSIRVPAAIGMESQSHRFHMQLT